MGYVVIICSIIIIILVISYFNIKNKMELFQLDNEKINESIKNIDLYLEKKEEYLERALDTIKNSNKKKYCKKNIMESLIMNKNKKLDRTDMYKELDNNLSELYKIIDDDVKLKEVRKLNDIIYDIKNNESDLMASINFYNDSIEEIKKVKKSFLGNILFKDEDNDSYLKFEVKSHDDLSILKENNNNKKTHS